MVPEEFKKRSMIPRIKSNFMRPSGTGLTWKFDLDPLPKKFDNYFIEACRAAEEIYDLKEGKLHVMYSGGVDSEHALAVFLHLGIDVTPVIVKLSPDYNNHDISYALKFCEKKNIKPRIIEIDFKKFLESGKFEEVNNIIKSNACGRASTCYALGQVDGSIVCGEGDPHISKDPTTEIWYFNDVEHAYSMNTYREHKGIDGTIFFNGYTPEMYSAFLTDPRMRNLADNKVPGKLGSHSSKYIIYNRHSGFNLEKRPKYHGFEKILETELITHPDFVRFFDPEFSKIGTFGIPYYDVIKDLI
jgi:hypothetical protein